MMKRSNTSFILVACLMVLNSCLKVQNDPFDALPNKNLEHDGKKAEIMVLGTFHFANPGNDQYKPKYTINVLSAKRQKEIENILRLLEAYQPTKIAVEVRRTGPDTLLSVYPKRMNLKGENQGALDSLYHAYLQGTLKTNSSFVPKSNEVYQLGFRLAKQLGHENIYAIDATIAPFFMKYVQNNIQALTKAYKLAQNNKWMQASKKRSVYEDSVKMTQTIRETLLHMNSPERVKQSLGDYLVGLFKAGGKKSYLGPNFVSRWWNRNLHIFRNIQLVADSPDDRILVIIGAGHLSVLRNLFMASPQFEWVEVKQYLGNEAKAAMQ